MPTNTYDLIVLGDEFSGVVAATLCAARGMRVLLGTTGANPASYHVGPHRLPTRPLSFVGLTSPAIRRVIEELNFAHLLKRRLRECQPAFQFVGPNARIDVSGDDVELTFECQRDLENGDADAVLASCRTAREVSELLEPILGQAIAFPPEKFFDKREIGRCEAPLALAGEAVTVSTEGSAIARALVEAPAAVSVRADPRELSAICRARAFDLWRRGTAQLPGGYQTLREIFLDKFASHGGEVRAVAAEELSISWGKVTGVMLREREELGAEQVIAAMPLDELQELTAKVPKKMREVAEQFTPAAYRYTLNLVLSEAGIPEGIGSMVLFVNDPDEPLIGDNCIAVYIDEPDEEARVTVTAEAVCPAPGPNETLEGKFADLRIRLRERLEELMPFSSEHVLIAHSPHERTSAEGTKHKVDLIDPTPPVPAWHTQGESLLGLAVAPYHLGIKRLTLASSQVMPGLGLEGEFEVGWCAALIACSGLKKKDYLKDEVLAPRG